MGNNLAIHLNKEEALSIEQFSYLCGLSVEEVFTLGKCEALGAQPIMIFDDDRCFPVRAHDGEGGFTYYKARKPVSRAVGEIVWVNYRIRPIKRIVAEEIVAPLKHKVVFDCLEIINPAAEV